MSIRKFRCIVIRIPQDQPTATEVDVQQFDEIELPPGPRGEVLPWADPYIMRLIDRCQQEARREMGLPAKRDPRQSRFGAGDQDCVDIPPRPAGGRPVAAAQAALPRQPR